jgi:hypothetical protein
MASLWRKALGELKQGLLHAGSRRGSSRGQLFRVSPQGHSKHRVPLVEVHRLKREWW